MKPQTSLQNFLRQILRLSEFFGLTVIGLATTYAMAMLAWSMASIPEVTLTDLLLMFLYLEILSMVTQYFRAGQLPVRFPLYIAIVALARQLILGMETASEMHMIAVASSIFLLSLGVLLIRYGQSKYPSSEDIMREDTSPYWL